MSFTGQLFLLGTSAGGVTALHALLENLDARMHQPIVVVQHLPEQSNVDVRNIYATTPGRQIVEVEDKMPIEPNTVYFAPGGYHLLFTSDQCFSLNQEEPVNFSRPSIDVSFQCAAEVFGSRLVGVLLTGANADGAQGLLAIRKAGGKVIVQDPRDAEFGEMPKAALALQQPDFVTALKELPSILSHLGGVAR